MSDLLLFISNFTFRIAGSEACLPSHAVAPPEFVTHSASLWSLGLGILLWFHDPGAPLAHENSPPHSLAPGIPNDSVQGEGSVMRGQSG